MYFDADGTKAVDNLRRVLVQPDGGFVAVGHVRGSTQNRDKGKVLLARFTASGAVDRSYGRGGRVVVRRADVNGWPLQFAAGAVADGRATVVSAGASAFVRGQTRDVAAVFGVRADGTLDPSFGR